MPQPVLELASQRLPTELRARLTRKALGFLAESRPSSMTRRCTRGGALQLPAIKFHACMARAYTVCQHKSGPTSTPSQQVARSLKGATGLPQRVLGPLIELILEGKGLPKASQLRRKPASSRQTQPGAQTMWSGSPLYQLAGPQVQPLSVDPGQSYGHLGLVQEEVAVEAGVFGSPSGQGGGGGTLLQQCWDALVSALTLPQVLGGHLSRCPRSSLQQYGHREEASKSLRTQNVATWTASCHKD